MPRNHTENWYLEQMVNLIHLAEADDVVITIHLEPLKPLAMGNYKMTPAVRARQERHCKEKKVTCPACDGTGVALLGNVCFHCKGKGSV